MSAPPDVGRRLMVGMLAACALVASYAFGSGDVGTTVTSTNGVTLVAASTGMVNILAGVAIAFAYFAALDGEGLSQGGVRASTGRRAVAWFLDFILALSALASVTALLPLAKEAIATGHFEWSFQRDYATASDWILGLLTIALVFGGMAAYWAAPVMTAGQTIGQVMLGVRVVPKDQAPLSWSRNLVRGLAIAFAPLLWLARTFSGKDTFWHDDFASVIVVDLTKAERVAS